MGEIKRCLQQWCQHLLKHISSSSSQYLPLGATLWGACNEFATESLVVLSVSLVLTVRSARYRGNQCLHERSRRTLNGAW